MQGIVLFDHLDAGAEVLGGAANRVRGRIPILIAALHFLAIW
jgi:hypothetical protein